MTKFNFDKETFKSNNVDLKTTQSGEYWTIKMTFS